MQGLSGRVTLNLLFDPVLSIPDADFAEARLFVVHITKLAASKLDDLEREMMPNAMDVVRQLLRVRVGLVLGFRLDSVSMRLWFIRQILLTETTCTSRFRWRHCSLHHSVISGCPAGTNPKPLGAFEAYVS